MSDSLFLWYDRIMKRWKKAISIALGLVFLLYSILAIAVGLRVYRDTSHPADAILILGAKSYKGTTYNPCLVARVKHGVELYQTGFASTIIVSGGNDKEDGSNEAATMRRIALSLGVPMEAILTENTSTSTFENFMNSKKIMDQNQFHSAIIVTEPFHMPRAAMVARRVGMPAFVSPTVDSPCWTRWKFGSRYFLKEPLAIVGYFLTGKLMPAFLAH